jgi:hypothetical protein
MAMENGTWQFLSDVHMSEADNLLLHVARLKEKQKKNSDPLSSLENEREGERTAKRSD